jgi:hypothetical protein
MKKGLLVLLALLLVGALGAFGAGDKQVIAAGEKTIALR